MNLLDFLGDLFSALFNWPSRGNPTGRVLSPGFLVLCVAVVVVELTLLHLFFGAD